MERRTDFSISTQTPADLAIHRPSQRPTAIPGALLARDGTAELVLDGYDTSCPREMLTTARAAPQACEPLLILTEPSLIILMPRCVVRTRAILMVAQAADTGR